MPSSAWAMFFDVYGFEVEGKKKTKGKPTGAARGKPKKTSKGGGNTTGALEKKKRRGESGGVRPKKCSHLIDTFFTQSLLCRNGDSEARVDPKVKPRKQRLRTMSEDRKKAAQGEVQKLLDAGVIRELQYPEWLANVVMVSKKNGSWRICALTSPLSISFARTMNSPCPALIPW